MRPPAPLGASSGHIHRDWSASSAGQQTDWPSRPQLSHIWNFCSLLGKGDPMAIEAGRAGRRHKRPWPP